MSGIGGKQVQEQENRNIIKRSMRASAGSGNRQDRESEIADAGTGGKQVQEQAEQEKD